MLVSKAPELVGAKVENCTHATVLLKGDLCTLNRQELQEYFEPIVPHDKDFTLYIGLSNVVFRGDEALELFGLLLELKKLFHPHLAIKLIDRKGKFQHKIELSKLQSDLPVYGSLTEARSAR